MELIPVSLLLSVMYRRDVVLTLLPDLHRQLVFLYRSFGVPFPVSYRGLLLN